MKKIIFSILFFFLTSIVIAQEFQISGVVMDQQSKKPISKVLIYSKGTTTAIETDVLGRYNFQLKKEEYTFVFDYPGFCIEERAIDLMKDMILNIQLRVCSKTLFPEH